MLAVSHNGQQVGWSTKNICVLSEKRVCRLFELAFLDDCSALDRSTLHSVNSLLVFLVLVSLISLSARFHIDVLTHTHTCIQRFSCSWSS